MNLFKKFICTVLRKKEGTHLITTENINLATLQRIDPLLGSMFPLDYPDQELLSKITQAIVYQRKWQFLVQMM